MSKPKTTPPNPRLQSILDNLPDSPGVYLHKDASGAVLYVGKAKSLRSRVRSYFQPSASHGARIAAMVRQVDDIGLLTTHSETEALILEATLIKKHQPRYNVLLKDDKSYPFFKLTVNERFPRLYLVRDREMEKGAEYFGPYTAVRDARDTLAMIHRYFRLRTSKWKLDGSKTYRPCINYQLGKCLAPCTGQVAPEQYGQLVERVRQFFSGKDQALLDWMAGEMERLSHSQRYEEAARMRDAIQAVRRTLEKQRVMGPDGLADQDVFALYREAGFAGVEVLFIRHGRLLGNDCFFLDNTDGKEDEELLKGVLNRLYTRPSAVLPKEVVLPMDYEDRPLLEQFLTQQKGEKVRLTVAQRGDKRRLVEMAQDNARQAVKERMARTLSDEMVLEAARQTLHLRRLPHRVEAFDISNIQGAHTVASLVSWHDNRPDKAHYRKFKIRSVSGPDDFASMEEALTRRYQRLLAEGGELPELILIDGGKGQVNMAWSVLERLGVSPTQVDMIGLAKGRTEKRRRGAAPRLADFEYVVKPQMKNEIRLTRNSSTLHFLQRIRDESHRFAITFHRQLRSKATLRSALDSLPGVGPKRAKILLRHFGSFKRVSQASLEELERVPGIPAPLARQLHGLLAGLPQNPPEGSESPSSEPQP